MPNLRGGKAYKRSKGASDGLDVVFLEREPDQMVGRIVRLLGSLNTQIFCQDNKQRICKISTGIKKRTRFEAGDIVLISLRDCEVSKTDLLKGIRSDRGDIIGKFHPQQYNSLKEEGINSHIFVNMETIQEISEKLASGDITGAAAAAAADQDNFFDMTGTNEEEKEDENGEEKDNEEGLARPTKPWKEVRAARTKVQNETDEVDISTL
jgi:initiation factor 1A